MHYWVSTVYPFMPSTPEQFTMPPMPDLPDTARIEATWTAYWSPRVRQLMQAWEAAVRGLQVSGMSIGFGRDREGKRQQPGIDVPGLLKELPAVKQAVRDADNLIREQVRLELLGLHDGHAAPAEPAARCDRVIR